MIDAIHKSRLGHVWTSRNLAAFIILSLFTLSLMGQYSTLFISSQASENFVIPQDSAIAAETPVNKIYSEFNNSLGEIAITHIYNMSGPYFSALPEGSNLIYSYDFYPIPVQTIKNASIMNGIKNGDEFRSNITVRLNETVFWKYNSSTLERKVGFQSKFQSARLNRLFITLNQSLYPFVLANDTDFWVSENGMFYFNFTNLFEMNENGSFYLKYEYEIEIPINQWTVDAIMPSSNDGNIYLNENSSSVNQQYRLSVTLGALNDIELDARFVITLPDPNDVTDLFFEKYNNDVPQTTYHQNFTKDNSISFRAEINETQIQNQVDITFNAVFNVSFLDKVNDDNFWTKDRLIEGFKNRERDYKITVTSGPAHLAVKYLCFNESLIYYEDTTSRVFSSKNGRTVGIENMNKSSYVQVEPNEPFEYVGYRTNGISVLGSNYFIYKGEVDIISVRYMTARNLQIKVMDNIENPLRGYKVNFFFAGQNYGSVISPFQSVPYPTKTCDQYGIITVENVPRGNYTIEILDAKGKYIESQIVDSEVNMNEVITEVLHFPTVILIYTAIFAAIFVAGFMIYRKNTQ